MTTLVIIPTFNEVANVGRIIPEVLSQHPDLHVLVVDDNSPDGTAGAVRSLPAFGDRIHLIEREGKMGLGTAYVRGFQFALAGNYDYVMEMDADFSHNPAEIPNFLRTIQDYDLVLGSRYISGVNVINWPLRRLILSYGANMYTRIVTGIPVRDSTGGFKCFRRKVLEALDLDRIQSNGYAFQIEVTYKAWKRGFRIKEIPIIFTDRVEGSSKMSNNIVREAIWVVWKLRLLAIIGRL